MIAKTFAKIVSAGRWSAVAAHRRQQQRVLYSEEAGGAKRLAGDKRLDVGRRHGNQEDQEHAGGVSVGNRSKRV